MSLTLDESEITPEVEPIEQAGKLLLKLIAAGNGLLDHAEIELQKRLDLADDEQEMIVRNDINAWIATTAAAQAYVNAP